MAMSKKLVDRLKTGIKQYHSILKAQRDRDVSEADTVTVVKDMLEDVFGFDKYSELTGEYAIRGTYCDLAIKLDGKIKILLEVKAIGITLKERHVKQAVDYAANEGIEWVLLTNGIHWHLYHMLFRKPIDKEEIMQMNFLELSSRKSDDLELLYVLCKEGIKKSSLKEYRSRQQAISRFMLAAILTRSESVLRAIRKDVRAISDVLIDTDDIAAVLRDDVIKRESLEGEESLDASKAVVKLNKPKSAKSRKPKKPTRVIVTKPKTAKSVS